MPSSMLRFTAARSCVTRSGALGSDQLRVLIRNARAHTANGTTNSIPNLTPRCRNLRQIKHAGDFEGVVTLGIGFRVSHLTNPTRVVIVLTHHRR
jgi:hypothetical protein